MNFRNRVSKEQDRYREHGVVDVLTALLPALDDIDRIRANSQMDDSFKAVAAKIDKTFEKFGVEKSIQRITRALCASQMPMLHTKRLILWWKLATR